MSCVGLWHGVGHNMVEGSTSAGGAVIFQYRSWYMDLRSWCNSNKSLNSSYREGLTEHVLSQKGGLSKDKLISQLTKQT